MESPVHATPGDTAMLAPLARAVATVASQAPNAPIDKVVLQLKGPAPTIAVFTGKRGGGEDKQYVIDARNGAMLRMESYEDKPLLYRLHSGEAFGDGGLVVAMGWGLALLWLTVSGLVIYWRMRRRDASGWNRVFW
jgi:uncharacterized iron-regulated membrane protein